MLIATAACPTRRVGTIFPSSPAIRTLVRAHYGQLPVVGAPVHVASSRTKHTTSPSSSTSAPSPLPSPHHADSQISIYEGPFSQTAKRLKLFSVSSLGATIALCPFIFLLDAGLSTGARGGLAAAAVFTSGSSTALVQWCLGSYVRTITLPKSLPVDNNNHTILTRSTPVSFETLSFWGGKRITTVKVSDLEPSSAPFSTIRIRDGQHSTVRDGRGRILSDGNQFKKRFYLHSELTEEEPLRTIMAEVQQNQHPSASTSTTPTSMSSTTASSSPQGTETDASKKTAGGMSDRIEQLKRKAAENANKEQ
ncbi:hypothetical protein BGZ83_012098 [Gryganskiella cystojenkinii]|nr:hypothetical protein BGZ83_012098 [Gryganskiella cystojenkinii]